jgi:hypothetical protein
MDEMNILEQQTMSDYLAFRGMWTPKELEHKLLEEVHDLPNIATEKSMFWVTMNNLKLSSKRDFVKMRITFLREAITEIEAAQWRMENLIYTWGEHILEDIRVRAGKLLLPSVTKATEEDALNAFYELNHVQQVIPSVLRTWRNMDQDDPKQERENIEKLILYLKQKVDVFQSAAMTAAETAPEHSSKTSKVITH